MSETNQKIYFHIGPPKTGSTAIQMHMDSHREQNARDGVWYPRTTAVQQSRLEKHLFLPFSMHKNAPWVLSFYSENKISDNLADYTAIRQAGLTDIQAAVRAGLDIVISSEGMFSEHALFKRKVGEISAANAARFAKAHGLTPRIIFYLRHPVEFWLSQLHQNVAQHVIGTDEQIVRMGWYRLQLFQKKIEMLSRIFGKDNLIIRTFDTDTFTGGTIVNDFRSAVGLPQIEDNDPRRNPRDGGKTIRLRLEMHRRILGHLDDQFDPYELFSPLSKSYPEAFPGDTSHYLPPRSLFLETLEKMEPYRRYFFELTGNTKLFGPGYADKYLDQLTERAQPELSREDLMSALEVVQNQADYQIAEAMLNHADIRQNALWFLKNIQRFRDKDQLQDLSEKAEQAGAGKVASLARRMLMKHKARSD